MSDYLSSQTQDMEKPNSVVWDCGSSVLYDSFELESFERQLDSAISSRTLSMPHLPGHRSHPSPPPPHQLPKKSSKVSRSFHKLIRSIFGPKHNTGSWFKGQNGNVTQDHHHHGYYFFYDGSGALTTIPEVPEAGGDHGGVSPDTRSVVGKSASARFTATSVGISCP